MDSAKSLRNLISIIVTIFVLGVAIGAGLTILTSPASAYPTEQEVQDLVEEYYSSHTYVENVIFSNIQEQDGSLGSSLGQVFGTESQKTNERGDYYTTSAGGGAGAVKGKSLGEMFIDTVKNVTTSKGVDTKIYTGASTASQKTIGDIGDIDFKSLIQVNNDMGASTLGKNPDGSSLFSSPFALPSSSGESKSLTTTKKTSGIKTQGN